MVSMIVDLWNDLGERLFPNLVKQRDMALEKVHDLTQSHQSLAELHFVTMRELTKIQAMLGKSQEPPKIQRAATPAEVRRLTEHAFAMEDDDVR